MTISKAVHNLLENLFLKENRHPRGSGRRIRKEPYPISELEKLEMVSLKKWSLIKGF